MLKIFDKMQSKKAKEVLRILGKYKAKYKGNPRGSAWIFKAKCKGNAKGIVGKHSKI